MNIEIYALCHNEERIIPYFMRHYNQYGHVFLFEGHSTDDSVRLAQKHGATVIPLDTKNEVNDEIFTNIKNNCWKQSQAEWCIVCDMDEFIYHPDMLNYLEGVDADIIVPHNHEMFSDVFPTTKGQIYEEVTQGFKYLDDKNKKFFMFRPQSLTSMNYGIGCHTATPIGNPFTHIPKISYDTEIISMHMKHLSVDYVVQRNAYLASRMSFINKSRGWGWHVSLPPSSVTDYFEVNRPNLIKVI